MQNNLTEQKQHKTLKTRIITLFFLLALLPVQAQTTWGDAFNRFKIEARADGELFTTDSTPQFGFHGKYFNLKLGGELGGGFSYYFMQRLVANPGTVMFFDNTDFLYLDYKPTANWRLRFGKDAMAMGGFEYDAAPIDVYFPTTLWNSIYCFQLGLSGAYISDDGNHTLVAQVTNSPYINSNGWNYDAGLVSYNLCWYGNVGHWHTIWSSSMIEREWSKFMNLTMIGNKFTFEKWDIYIDFMHHALAINDWGKNFGVVSCANYYFTPDFNIFVKGMFEQNKSEVDLNSAVALDHLLLAGHTYVRYGLGFEWYPKGMKNVRLHTYACRMQEWDVSNTMTEDCWNFNIGATWSVDYYQLFKK